MQHHCFLHIRLGGIIKVQYFLFWNLQLLTALHFCTLVSGLGSWHICQDLMEALQLFKAGDYEGCVPLARKAKEKCNERTRSALARWFMVCCGYFWLQTRTRGLPEMIRAQSHFLTLYCTSFQPFSSCEQPLGTKTIHNLRYSTSENYVLFYFGTGWHFQLNALLENIGA